MTEAITIHDHHLGITGCTVGKVTDPVSMWCLTLPWFLKYPIILLSVSTESTGLPRTSFAMRLFTSAIFVVYMVCSWLVVDVIACENDNMLLFVCANTYNFSAFEDRLPVSRKEL